MDITSLMALGNFGLSLLGASRAKALADRQEAFYNREASFNAAVGEFNAQVAARSGYENAVTISEQTKEVLGMQLAEFNRRGVSLEGSPQFILAKTVNTGLRGAKNALFEAGVTAYNARQNASNIASQGRMMASQAGAESMNQTFNLFRTMVSGMNVLKGSSYLGNSFQQGNPFSPGARAEAVQRIELKGSNG
jgi:hypothetical protein